MIGAVVLAAGLSRRMGQPKLVMPWGETTVVGKVVDALFQAGVGQICVVSGGAHQQLAGVLSGQPVELVYNPRYQEDQMILSLQVGLGRLSKEVEAALVVLGDQPQIELEVIRAVVDAYRERRAALVIPSYQMRRGHPWLVARDLWADIFALEPPATLRDFLAGHSEQIHYLTVETPSILQDLDTPEDYARHAPK